MEFYKKDITDMTIEEAIEHVRSRKMSISMCVSSKECRLINHALDMAIHALTAQQDLRETSI